MLQILLYPDKRLKQMATPVTFPLTPETTELVEGLLETMKVSQGLGIGATQAGYSEAIFVVDDQTTKTPSIFINPEIIEKSIDMDSMEEGCLSLPGVNAKVKRHKTVKVRAQNPDGTFFEVFVADLPARIMQHEIDHLNGVLFIDRLGPTYREMIKKKFSKRNKKPRARF